ncbi:MAG: ABC transporter permease [Candidatus Acidiferrales bacterium]
MTGFSIRELWRYRELLYFFAWRDIKVRYRQAALGAAWALLQPVITMIMFTLLFGRLAHLPSNGIPYPLFVYCALVPWTYFSGVLALASNSLVNNDQLITKVYFPRVLLPAGTAVAGLLDFIIGSILLVALMSYYHVTLSWVLLLSPLVVLVMVLLTTGVSMAMAAANVRYRDVKYALPFIIQTWMFATPIIYPATMIPSRFRPLLALNPCWGMVEAFRACLLPGPPVDFKLIGTSVGVTIAIFICGAYYFQRTQRTFADII